MLARRSEGRAGGQQGPGGRGTAVRWTAAASSVVRPGRLHAFWGTIHRRTVSSSGGAGECYGDVRADLMRRHSERGTCLDLQSLSRSHRERTEIVTLRGLGAGMGGAVLDA